jgi:OOP family OmpA-OmpF porin
MRRPHLVAALALSVLIAACGGEAPPVESASDAPAVAARADASDDVADTAGTAAAESAPGTPGDLETFADGAEAAGLKQGGTASLDDLQDLPFGAALAEAARRAEGETFDPSTAPAEGPVPGVDGKPADAAAQMADATARLEQQKAQMAAVMAAMQELAAAGSDPEKRAAAMEKVKASQRAMRDQHLQAESDRRAAALAGLPEDWQQIRLVRKDAPEADLLVQLGDIDNMGFGWPTGFDPFTGKSTPVHRFPYLPESDDPAGTDRIMVVSGFTGGVRQDGYTQQTSRPSNQPKPLVLEFDLQGVEVKTVALQLFVDDFQSKSMKSRYRAWIDGRELSDVAVVLNALDQTGPIGKLLTLQLLPEYVDTVRDGRVEIRIDDPDNNAGDGFAFDFVRLLVNPKGYAYTGTVRGIAVDTKAGRPLAGVLVSAGNVVQALSDDKGGFVLEKVPAGLVVTTGSKPDYSSDSEAADLVSGETVDVVLELTPTEKDSESLAEELERVGKVDLYGIYFDTAKATLKPESETTLQQVLGVLTADPALKLVIAGHTDSEGGDGYNQDLSEQRAASVVAWLTGKGVDAGRLSSEGLGETRPVADNGNAAGRALNRRVEVRVAD